MCTIRLNVYDTPECVRYACMLLINKINRGEAERSSVNNRPLFVFSYWWQRVLVVSTCCASCIVLSQVAHANSPGERAIRFTEGRYDTPWLSKGNAIACLVRVADDRGFDAVSIESWSATPDAPWVLMYRESLLADEVTWYRGRGELELYERDLQAVLRAKKDALVQEGWKPPAPLMLEWKGIEHPGRKLPALSRGILTVNGVVLPIAVHREKRKEWVEVTRPLHGSKVVLAELARENQSGRQKSAAIRQLGRVSHVWVTHDAQWLVLQLVEAPSLHGLQKPSRVIKATALQPFVRILELPTETDALRGP